MADVNIEAGTPEKGRSEAISYVTFVGRIVWDCHRYYNQLHQEYPMHSQLFLSSAAPISGERFGGSGGSERPDTAGCMARCI